MMLNIFLCAKFAISIFFFMPYAHFLICIFSTVEFGELFVCFRYKSVVGYVTCKYFISVHLLSLHSTNTSFAKQKLILMRPNLAGFFFICFGSCFWCLKQTQNASWAMPDSSCPFISYGFRNLTSRCLCVPSSFSWYCLNLYYISYLA